MIFCSRFQGWLQRICLRQGNINILHAGSWRKTWADLQHSRLQSWMKVQGLILEKSSHLKVLCGGFQLVMDPQVRWMLDFMENHGKSQSKDGTPKSSVVHLLNHPFWGTPAFKHGRGRPVTSPVPSMPSIQAEAQFPWSTWSFNSLQYWTGWWFQHPSEKYEFVNWDD